MERCNWAYSELMKKYHDEEWGEPTKDDNYIFEIFMLEGFQAGISWEIVLNKRENFRKAFDGFDYKKIAEYDEIKINELLQDVGIVRSGQKIRAAINNANHFIEVQKEFGSFANYIWGFSNGEVIKKNYEVNFTKNIEKDLKKRGFKFMGFKTLEAFLFAIGVIAGHEEQCYKYQNNEF